MKTTLRWRRSVAALTATRPATTSQHSLPWHSSTDTQTHSPADLNDNDVYKIPTMLDSDLRHTSNASHVRPMSELDGPSGWPLIGNFLTYLKKENRGQMHLVQMELHRKYGKMFREKWGGKWQLHVSDADIIEQVFRSEGRYPHRPGLPSWTLYMRSAARPPGLFIVQGEQWQRQRQVLAGELLSRDMVSQLTAPIASVTDDFISRLRDVRESGGDRAVVDQLTSYVHRWTLEASGSFLFETRLGCLQLFVPARTSQFIEAMNEMMDSSLYLIVGDRLHRALNTSYWRRHTDAWDQLFNIATELINERLASLQQNDSRGGGGLFLTRLLRNRDIDMHEINSVLLDLLIAGTDTTANTYCFLVHLLATHPDVQQRLYSEVSDAKQQRQPVAAAAATDCSQFKYLNCVIKEAMRLYPAVTMNCRVLDEDSAIGGFFVPKQTLIVMNQYVASRDPDVFEDADRFLPERWMRSTTRSQSLKHPFACLPFGFGSRSCIGRRIAVMELTTILIKTLINFKLEVYPGVELQPMLRTLLTPGDRVPVRFVDRSVADQSLDTSD